MKLTTKEARGLGLKVPKGKKATAPLRGEVCAFIWLSIPFPPAANNLYATVRGRRVLSKRGREYKEAVGVACAAQRVGHVAGRLSVEIWAYPPDNRRRDLDGLLKASVDSLVAAGVLGDDSQIDHLNIHRCGVCQAVPRLKVRLTGDVV